MTKNPHKPTVAIAGASGFVGTALRKMLQPDYHIVALTRSPNRANMHHPDDPTEWRLCDLFSLSDVIKALEGVDYAYYLVHSMLPSSRLTQANFMDLDLLLGDNFGRAAQANQLSQIVYLGGLLPEEEPEENLSRHLRSRLEVEKCLYDFDTPVTSLRAGLIVGQGGSSLRMMVKLVQRLPIMVLPSWTLKQTQPIALQDVMKAMRLALGNTQYYNQAYDIGGPEVMTYRGMMERTAKMMNRKRFMLPVPLVSPTLSKYWVVSFSGSSMALTGPLVESLRHNMVVRDNPLQRELSQFGLKPFEAALRESLNEEGKEYPNPRKAHRKKDDEIIKQASYVRSVQRLPLPESKDAYWVAREYLRWLPHFVWPFLRVVVSHEGEIYFYFWPLREPLLQLRFQADQSPRGRQLFLIVGGFLAQVEAGEFGRLEFREVLQKRHIIAAIHDFRPRLPWYLYNASQALVHLLVMIGYRKHLRRLSQKQDGQLAYQPQIAT